MADKRMLNQYGYRDLTAYMAVKQVERVEKERDAEVNGFIRKVKELARVSGLRIVGRIEVQDTRSGKVYL